MKSSSIHLSKKPKVSRRKKHENKTRLEIDGNVALFQFFDKHLLVDKLQEFVAKNVDNVPSAKIENGELRYLLNRIDKLRSTQQGNFSKKECDRAKIVDALDKQAVCIAKVDSRMNLCLTLMMLRNKMFNRVHADSFTSASRGESGTHNSAMEDADDDEDECMIIKPSYAALVIGPNPGKGYECHESYVIKTGKKRRRTSQRSPINDRQKSVTSKNVRKDNKPNIKTIVGTKDDGAMKAAKSLTKKKVFFI